MIDLVNPYRDHSKPCVHGSYLRCHAFVNEAGDRADTSMPDNQVIKCPGGAPLPDDVTDIIVAFQARDDWRDAVVTVTLPKDPTAGLTKVTLVKGDTDDGS